jgi:hypothetical protein
MYPLWQLAHECLDSYNHSRRMQPLQIISEKVPDLAYGMLTIISLRGFARIFMSLIIDEPICVTSCKVAKYQSQNPPENYFPAPARLSQFRIERQKVSCPHIQYTHSLVLAFAHQVLYSKPSVNQIPLFGCLKRIFDSCQLRDWLHWGRKGSTSCLTSAGSKIGIPRAQNEGQKKLIIFRPSNLSQAIVFF